eukprot:TRINITY_DN6431_c0_g1_i3.p1 TRINITY_DN6431_c0_g1~~TRINITY_DN6431_c0_g1_i3.p1  ORF type:complete len:117 (+),score=35.26 TRINITY_DN6431_c0_g1_i3:125-475(+)
MDPRIHFVLSWHNKSSPSLRLIKPDNLDHYLDVATKEYVEQFVTVSLSKKQVVLSKLFKWFSEDFGSTTEMLNWILSHLTGAKKKELSHLLEDKSSFKVVFQCNWTPSPLPFRQFL